MLPVARRLPQFRVEDVGRDDFLETSVTIFAANEFDERIVDVCPVRGEEAGSGAQLVEEEQLLVETQFAMVSLSSFLL